MVRAEVVCDDLLCGDRRLGDDTPLAPEGALEDGGGGALGVRMSTSRAKVLGKERADEGVR